MLFPAHRMRPEVPVMEDARVALEAALRVLTAMNNRRVVNPSDVEALRRQAPLLAGAAPDVLACYVAQQAMERRRPLI